MSKKTGFLFWITGLSGSGKTTLAKRILPYIRAKLGTTVRKKSYKKNRKEDLKTYQSSNVIIMFNFLAKVISKHQYKINF